MSQLEFEQLLNFDARELAAEPNKMRLAYGPGPRGKRCKECVWLVGWRYANVYYKCRLRGMTHGPATDHRVNWKACGKFEQR